MIFKKMALCLGTLACYLALAVPSWAGDEMNIRFLTAEAQEKNATLLHYQQQLKEVLYGASPEGHIYNGLGVVTNLMWGIVLAVPNAVNELATGLGAVVLGSAVSIATDIHATRSNAEIRHLLAKIDETEKGIQADVRTQYEAFKTGSTEAKTHLITLVGSDAVAEVSEELKKDKTVDITKSSL